MDITIESIHADDMMKALDDLKVDDSTQAFAFHKLFAGMLYVEQGKNLEALRVYLEFKQAVLRWPFLNPEMRGWFLAKYKMSLDQVRRGICV